ncbi:MAG TPA: hypothetical protein VFI65_32365 [Streptosporangiaceae bacterium]|nr:hypothetical protein [Streptosporangiaceae bacterium]
MAEAGPACDPQAYVVRYGGRAMLRTAAYLLGGLAIIVFVIAIHESVVAVGIALIVAAILICVGVVELSKVARRKVAFAVHQGGVFFGSGAKDNVPWSQICAVEFFTETFTTSRSQTTHRCIGVRSFGSRQIARPGNGPAARPWPERSIQYMIDAGRPDLIPGADGTIRYAYRQMVGWRVDQGLVAAAVARYAPGLPVIKGPDYPPAVTKAEAFAARRNRRASWF